MSSELEEWELFSERIFRTKGKPGRQGLIAIVLVGISETITISSLLFLGRISLNMIDLQLVLSLIAAMLFFGVFGWGAIFMKKAYIKTIEQLTFKDPTAKVTFLTPEAVFSRRYAAIGVFVTYLALGIALATWPLILAYFPLTLEVLPSFAFAMVLMVIVAILGVDACGAIPKLMTVPRRLRDHLQFNIMKPDRCGGAKSIGDFYFVFTLLVAAIGSLTIVISASFVTPFFGYIMAFIMMILAIAVFLIPQGSIRTILRHEKLSRLEEISERVELLTDPKTELDGEEMLVSFIQVQSLIMLYGEVEKLREFPFDVGTFQRVISAAIFPILLEIFIQLLIIYGT